MKVTTDACLFGAWVAAYLSERSNHETSILDIGTGTGLLSLMIAQKTNASIEAIELDEQAAIQARENVEASPWGNRIEVLAKDLRHFSPVKKYDQIIVNPPFYEKEIPSTHPGKNAAHHGEGLLLGELFDWVKMNLKMEGRFHALLPYKRKQEIQALLKKAGLFAEEWVVIKPTSQALPSRVLIRATFEEPLAVLESEQVITVAANQYSSFFRELLSDYYL